MVQGRWSNARASDESASQTSPLTVASSETDPPCLRERAVNAGSRGDTTLTGAKREIEEFLQLLGRAFDLNKGNVLTTLKAQKGGL